MDHARPYIHHPGERRRPERTPGTQRTDIAWHVEYNQFRSQGVGVNGGDQVGQTVLVGFDFAY